MKFRKLRVTLLALSTFASLHLTLFWVRSFQRIDIIRGFGLEFRSGYGTTMYLGRDTPAGLRFTSQAVDELRRNQRAIEPSLRVRGGRLGNHFWIAIPYWCLVAISTTSATIAAAPWFGWRFSLRLLILAMALIAVGLGISAFALRK